MQRGNSTGQREQTESHDIKQKRQFSAYKCGVLHVLLRVQTYSVWVSWPDCVFKWKAPSVWKLAAEMITDSDDTRWFPPVISLCVCLFVCVGAWRCIYVSISIWETQGGTYQTCFLFWYDNDATALGTCQERLLIRYQCSVCGRENG